MATGSAPGEPDAGEVEETAAADGREAPFAEAFFEPPLLRWVFEPIWPQKKARQQELEGAIASTFYKVVPS